MALIPHPISSSSDTERMKQVPWWLDELTVNIGTLEQHLSRLSPVIPRNNSVAETNTKPKEELCVLAERLRDLTGRVHDITAQIESVEL